MSESNSTRLARCAFVALLATGCTEEVIDTGAAATSLRVHYTEHNFGTLPEHRLRFLSKTKDGYVYGEMKNSRSASVVQTDELGTFISRRDFIRENWTLTDTDSLVNDFAVGISGGPLHLEFWVGFLQYADSRIGADPGLLFDIEIRMGSVHKQMAHRFWVPGGGFANAPLEDYVYLDYVEVPFTAWDVTSNPPRQLMVSFRDQSLDRSFNLVRSHDGTHTQFSMEFIFVHDIDYSAVVPDADLTSSALEVTGTVWLNPVLDYEYAGSWVPESSPAALISISRVEIPFFVENVSLHDINFVEETGEYRFLVSGYHKFNLGATAVSKMDANLVPTGGNTSFMMPSNSYWYPPRMQKTSDGGVVVTQAYANGDYFTKAVKISKSNNREFTVTKSGPINFVIEDRGTYFLADHLDVYRFDAKGIEKAISMSSSFYSMMTAVGSDQGVIGLYASYGVEPELVLFKDDFNVAGRKNFDPFKGSEKNVSFDPESTELCAMGDTLYFAGSPRDHPAFWSAQKQTSVFFVGRLDLGGRLGAGSQYDYELHDLGFPIQQNKTYFNHDGSAAHVVVLQTTATSSDVLFFRTDATFQIVKE